MSTYASASINKGNMLFTVLPARNILFTTVKLNINLYAPLEL